MKKDNFAAYVKQRGAKDDDMVKTIFAFSSVFSEKKVKKLLQEKLGKEYNVIAVVRVGEAADES